MRTTLFSIFFIILWSPSFGQPLPSGSTAPDFTTTDLDGVQHNLYSYLDQGYTVILEFSATWCGPCWDYHNEHHLANVYTDHGPGSADERVMVLFIEGDESTPVENLYGAGWSAGDWVTGSVYPIVNDHTVAELYGVNGYPKIYRVCPDRVLTSIGTQPADSVWQLVQECPYATQPNDPFLLPASELQGSCTGTEIPLVVKLQNNGTMPLTAASIQALHNGSEIASFEWIGSLPTYLNEDVTVGTFTPITAGEQMIEFQVVSADDDPANNSTTSVIVADDLVANSLELTLELRTDAYPYETTWQLLGPQGEVIAEDPVGTYSSHSVYTYQFDLESGACYVLQVHDSFGDGICCSSGQGYYKLIVDGTVIAQGGDFEEVAIQPFRSTMGTSVAETQDHGYTLYPNPSTGMVNIYPLRSGMYEIKVTDITGRIVREIMINDPSNDLDLSDLPNGRYAIEVKGITGSMVQQLILAR
jgi:thiol-disulfide isomerase/thioredoxin